VGVIKKRPHIRCRYQWRNCCQH